MRTTATLVTSTDGTQIYVDSAGDPTKPCIVFVHGLTLSSAVFDDMFQDTVLTDHYFLIRYDLRGHGRSGKPLTAAGHASALYASDFMAALDAFGVQQALHVGWSYGSSIAADVLANISPSPIVGSVAMAGRAILEWGGISMFSGVGDLLTALGEENDVTVSKHATQVFVDKCFHQPEQVSQVVRWSWMGMITAQPPAVTRLIVGRQQDATAYKQAVTNGFPVMVIKAENDVLVNSDIVIGKLGELTQGIEVCSIPGGHAVFYESKDETVACITQFAQSVFQ